MYKHMTLAELADHIRTNDEFTTQRRNEIRSAISTFAKVVRRPKAEISVEPDCIRTLAGKACPSLVGISKQRWKNVLSLVNTALANVNVLTVRSRQTHAMSTAWQELFRQLEEFDSRGLSHSISRFARWATSKKIEPGDVVRQTFEVFAKELTEQSSIREPRERMHVARRAWNEAVGKIPGWPQVKVPSTEEARCYARPWSDFPPTLVAEVERYRNVRTKHDLLNEDHKPLKRRSVEHQVGWLQRYASRLVDDGVLIDSVDGMKMLLDPEMAERGLQLYLQEMNQSSAEPPARVSALSNALVSAARFIHAYEKPRNTTPPSRNWGPGAAITDEQVNRLAWYAKRLRTRPTGIAEKNLERLKPLRDTRLQQRFLMLPIDTARRLAKVKSPVPRDAQTMQRAIAMEILMVAPMRVGNLAALDLDRHIVLPIDPSGETRIRIPRTEVKNCKDLDYILPPDTTRLVMLYLERFRPLLLYSDSRALFPGAKGGAITASALSKAISTFICRELDLTFHTHLFRHFCAFAYLKRHPGDYETLRRVLGHKNVSTTITFYAVVEEEAVARRFDEAILATRFAENGDADSVEAL